MDNQGLILIPYTHGSGLPCELNEVIGYIKKKTIANGTNETVGLSSDIYAIPLNRGYLLLTKEIILVSNSLLPLLQIDGTRSAEELNSLLPEMESNLQQLHYYNLLSFGLNNGRLILTNIAKEFEKLYTELYQDDYVTFPLIPSIVEVDITNRCNFQCIHCSRNSRPDEKVYSNDELSTEELLSIIDECAQIGVPELIFMGGEPLIQPDFLKLVQFAKKKGIRNIRISTNACNIDENIARELSKYCDHIQISIHGASSSTHDTIVGKKGALEKAKKAIRLLKKYNLKINVSFTIMRENIKDIRKMPYLVKEWGGDFLGFICLTRQGRGALLKGWNEEDIEKIGGEIKKIYENLPPGIELDTVRFPIVKPVKSDYFFYGCPAGKTLLSITSNGKAKACSVLDDCVGDIREESILDIWHSPQLIKMRKQLTCNCSFRPICYGPCIMPE